MKALAQNTLIQNRYLVVHLIGKGGMGEVYLAVDQRLGSAVALKRTYFAGDEMLGNAFEREARILARMRHPVLPKVSDHFGEGEEQYLVMEHISGDDLAKRLEAAQKSFPVSWVLFWADQLLDALSYLHSHEPPIIHRDIKPQNLKLTDENHIILLDFGLSKSSTGQTNISVSGSTGSVVGYTPHYAPMEQIRGIGTSPRSDLYSLSATLYQLMTNIVPADALTRADAMLNEMPDPIKPPHELNPEIPQSVSVVILKGMEVSQEKRYANAREMQKVLRKAFTQMQEAMSAQTIAFNMQDEQALGVKTEVMGIGQLPPGPPLNSQTDAPSVPHPEEDIPDLDATIAFEPNSQAEVLKQADVKTEVFLAGDHAFSIPEPEVRVQEQDLIRTPIYSEGSNFVPGQESDSGSGDIDEFNFRQERDVEAGASYSDSQNGSDAGAIEAPEFFTSANVGEQPNPFATVTVGNQSYSASRDVIGEIEPSKARTVPQPQRNEQKRSSGRAFAIIGGLAALFILAIGAAGAGWYLYTNYYSGSAVTEATPSPEPTLAISPTPEPTVESVFDANANTNTEITSDLNTNTAEPEQDTTAAPTSTGVNPRPTPQVATKTTPARTGRTPGVKPTPQPKKTGDRTVILQ